MNDSERYKLHGKYKTPRFRMGSVLTCEYRDCDVVVVGYSDGRIPWPRGRKRGLGTRGGFIVYGDLKKAIRTESNQAVAYWFGVTVAVVSHWRRALGVRFTNAGTRKLRQAHTSEDWFKEVQREGTARAQDPEVKQRRAASNRGRKLPPSHVQAISRGKVAAMTPETRAKISAARKESAKRKAAHGQIFTPQHDGIIRTHSASEAIKLTGRTPDSIYSRRKVLGITATPKRVPANFTPKHDEIIRKHRPSEAAKLTGRTMSSIYSRRIQLGITDQRK